MYINDLLMAVKGDGVIYVAVEEHQSTGAGASVRPARSVVCHREAWAGLGSY